MCSRILSVQLWVASFYLLRLKMIENMNGRTKYSINLFTSLASFVICTTFVGSQGLDLECNIAKCYFGTKLEVVRILVSNSEFEIPPPDNICSQTITPLILSAELPLSCGQGYEKLRKDLSLKCKTELSSKSCCGSTPDDVTGYIITYVILRSLFIQQPINE